MAGDDTQGSGPDLELPSLFRRREKKAGRKKRGAAAPEDAPTTPAVPVDDATEELPVTARPVAGDDTPTQPLRPVPGAARRPPTAPPPAAAPEPTPEPVAEPVAEREPVAEEPAPEPTPEREPVAEQPSDTRPPRPTGPPPKPRRRGPDMTWADDRETTSEPTGRVALAETPAPTPTPTPTPVERDTAASEPAAAEQETAGASRRRRPSLPSVELTVPDLSPRVAAAVTGVAVAVTGIVLVWLSLQACTTVRGVSSCGGIGLLGLVLTVVAQAAVGTILLGVLGVAEARSTAVLGVGVASFVAMVLLYVGLPGLWLCLALLVATPAAHVLAEGVTSGRFSDSG